MIFKQYEDGSCDIEFSQDEIKMLNEKQKLHLTSENLKHFGNTLVKMVVDWNAKFDEKTANLQTYTDTEIKSK